VIFGVHPELFYLLRVLINGYLVTFGAHIDTGGMGMDDGHRNFLFLHKKSA
jgi:hypothetical protein